MNVLICDLNLTTFLETSMDIWTLWIKFNYIYNFFLI